MPRFVVLALVCGCVTTSPTPTPTHTTDTSDTGTPAASCADELAPQTYEACVETTLPVEGPADFGYPMVLTGSGTVTEVGGELDPVPGSEPIDAFSACGPEHTHQVRIVDDAGEIWTFGWDVSGAVDDASTDVILGGTALDFHATVEWYSYSRASAVLLSDEIGPLFVLELGGYGSGVGDLAVELVTDTTCVVEADGLEYYQVSFTWTDGEAVLWSGETATVAAGGRELEVVLGDANTMLDCLDGCTTLWWAGWAEAD